MVYAGKKRGGKLMSKAFNARSEKKGNRMNTKKMEGRKKLR